MLTVWCSCISDGRVKKHKKITSDKKDLNEAFLECMTAACKAFDIETPMWHTKHTKQLNMFRKITFLKDDFIDAVQYDRFVIEVLETE